MRKRKKRTRTNLPKSGVLPQHVERKFRPTARQAELYRELFSKPTQQGLTVVGYGGAMGGGKTRAIAELAIDAALMYPRNNILVARQHFTDLSATTMKEFLRVCPPGYVLRRQQAPTQLVEVRLPGQLSDQASTINFRHLSDWTGLGSQQYGAVLIDEAGEVDEDAAQMLLTRLRHPAQPQRWFVAASNPWPGWFERWFVRRELPEAQLAEADGRIVYIPAKVGDNPHLPDNYAELQRALLPPAWVDRFIEGRFDVFSGLVYPEFDPARHRWDAPAPPCARYIGGLDFGGQTEQAHYTAGIVAGLTNRRAPCGPGVLIRLAEFEQRGPGVTERLERWMDACQRQFGRIAWRADRSQAAWIDHLRRRGRAVSPSSGGPGSVQLGIGLVQSRLAADPPQSYYAPNLTQFPRRIREYQWQRPHDHQPQPRKDQDDLLDADRYCHELAQTPPPARPAKVEIHIAPQRHPSWNKPAARPRSNPWSVRG